MSGFWCSDSSTSTQTLFSHSFMFENCVTVVNCYTTLRVMGNCTIQYGQDPSYQDFDPPISGPLNSSIPLPLMESSTLYYVQITFMLNSQPFILSTNYTTRNGMSCRIMALPTLLCSVLLIGAKHLIPVNIVLMTIGLMFWIAATLIAVISGIIACRYCALSMGIQNMLEATSCTVLD